MPNSPTGLYPETGENVRYTIFPLRLLLLDNTYYYIIHTPYVLCKCLINTEKEKEKIFKEFIIPPPWGGLEVGVYPSRLLPLHS